MTTSYSTFEHAFDYRVSVYNYIFPLSLILFRMYSTVLVTVLYIVNLYYIPIHCALFGLMRAKLVKNGMFTATSPRFDIPKRRRQDQHTLNPMKSSLKRAI